MCYFLLPTSYFLLPTSYFLLPTSYFLLAGLNVQPEIVRQPLDGQTDGRAVSQTGGPLGGVGAVISYERYAKTMQAATKHTFDEGDYVFRCLPCNRHVTAM
jgi:hypothetical protein